MSPPDPWQHLSLQQTWRQTLYIRPRLRPELRISKALRWPRTSSGRLRPAAASIIVPPTVISTIPANAATDVPFNQAVSATFSEAMNPSTINSATFNLTSSGGTPVAGLVAYAAIGNTLTFTPTVNLPPNTLFTAAITTGAQDLAGDALSSNYVWTFTTGSAPVVIPPELVATLPVNAATNVPLTQVVIATFSKAMDPLTITTATFQLTSTLGGSAIPATVTYDAVNFIATLTPTSPLTASTSYNRDRERSNRPSGRSIGEQWRAKSLELHDGCDSHSAAYRSWANHIVVWRFWRWGGNHESGNQHGHQWRGYRGPRESPL